MKTKLKNSYQSNKFLYNYKTDLAEINRFNYRLIIYNYFHLTTKKITLIAMLFAFNLVLTIFSRYVLGLVPIAGFFVIEISFASILMVTLINNFFYTLICLEITIWFRLALGSEPIGLIAMNLIDGFFLIGFCLTIFIFKRIAVKRRWKNWLKPFFVYQLLSILLITLLTSLMAVIFNYGFILQLYFPDWNKLQVRALLPVIFGLNIAKYLINGLLYFMAFKPLITLVQYYQA